MTQHDEELEEFAVQADEVFKIEGENVLLSVDPQGARRIWVNSRDSAKWTKVQRAAVIAAVREALPEKFKSYDFDIT